MCHSYLYNLKKRLIYFKEHQISIPSILTLAASLEAFAMSQVQVPVFSLILDPDLRCHVTKSSLRANPMLKSSQIISCGILDLFLASLQQVKQDSSVCVISCLAHLLASADGPSTVSLRIDPILQVCYKCFYLLVSHWIDPISCSLGSPKVKGRLLYPRVRLWVS